MIITYEGDNLVYTLSFDEVRNLLIEPRLKHGYEFTYTQVTHTDRSVRKENSNLESIRFIFKQKDI